MAGFNRMQLGLTGKSKISCRGGSRTAPTAVYRKIFAHVRKGIDFFLRYLFLARNVTLILSTAYCLLSTVYLFWPPPCPLRQWAGWPLMVGLIMKGPIQSGRPQMGDT